jgi:autoinducer 2-degrading protein
MIVTIVHVEVKPEHITSFIRATTENHLESVKEPGNLRFDVLQNDAEPHRFVLYEAYETDELAAAHKTTAHYLKWRETVAPWMASPREGIRHTAIVPEL